MKVVNEVKLVSETFWEKEYGVWLNLNEMLEDNYKSKKGRLRSLKWKILHNISGVFKKVNCFLTNIFSAIHVDR